MGKLSRVATGSAMIVAMRIAATPDELHDLQTVAIGETCFRPLRARKKSAIMFHGHTIEFQAKLLDQFRKGERGFEGTSITVDGKLHAGFLLSSKYNREYAR